MNNSPRGQVDNEKESGRKQTSMTGKKSHAQITLA
jgi:hypothetical protein